MALPSRLAFTSLRSVSTALVAVGIAAAGCTDQSATNDDASTANSVGQGNAQSVAGSSSSGDGRSVNDPSDRGTDGEEASGSGSDAGRPEPGPCSVNEMATEVFYAVEGIAEDDEDGGLNVRQEVKSGDKLGTLPEGAVVFVEDCIVADDGGIWWAVESAAGDTPDDALFGWVNSKWLSADIPNSERAPGEVEVADGVVALLDALAAGDWEAASEALQPGGEGYVGTQLDDGGDLPDQVQVYCSRVICDAKYEVIAREGSYVSERWLPRVDVRFSYPDGEAVETFEGRLDGTGSLVAINALPGQSILAQSSASPVGELAERGDGDLEAAGFYDAAEAIRQALLSEQSAGDLVPYVPEEGIAISTSAYVEGDPDAQVRVTIDDLAGGSESRIWGYTDGVGQPIVETVDERLANYRRDIALIAPDVVGIDERIGVGTTIANLPEVFPNAHVVEFHRRGRGELSDFNWSSVRIALEERDGGWVLVAITSDMWTV